MQYSCKGKVKERKKGEMKHGFFISRTVDAFYTYIRRRTNKTINIARYFCTVFSRRVFNARDVSADSRLNTVSLSESLLLYT